jgi:two-component sensor histidine kinase
LLQEVHHRVENNLQIIPSLLSLQADVIENSEPFAKPQDSQRRVLEMALSHEQLYNHEDMSSIDLAKYISELTGHLGSSSAKAGRIRHRLDVVSSKLQIDQAVPCGLILNELITNAIKYAYPLGKAEILVRLRDQDGSVTLTVSDTGVGMPPGYAVGATNHRA